LKLLRWLAKNIGTLLIALILAVIVWVSAVIASDPNEEHILGRPVQIDIIGQDPALQIMDEIPRNLTLVLRAPSSVWSQLNNDPQSVRAWVDLSNLGPGVHDVPVQIQITPNLVRLVQQDPEQLSVTLESIVSQVLPVTLTVEGEPPVGYQVQTPILNPSDITITGPKSLVDQVKEARVSIDITNANQSVITEETPLLYDAENKLVSGLTVSPDTVKVTQPITLLGGYRYVIIRTVSTGQVANGYRLTNIYVAPVGVVVFSADPELVNNLPGFVETQPIDLTGKEDDFETLVDLNLPAGISIVGDPKVLVQVSIAGIESSLAISLPVEVIGLAPGLQAEVAPTVVDVILSGPVPVLNTLGPADVRVVIDVSGYDKGTYQFIPEVNILPEQVQKISIVPSTVEVTITVAPTPLYTPTPGPSPTATRAPTATKTP
jgi:YbbR domain-containing protein